MNVFTFTATLCCLLFWILLVYVYFSKKNMSNIENKIFKYMVILNGLLTAASMVDLIAAYYLNLGPTIFLIYDVFSRIFCVSLMLWHMAILFYTIIVVINKDENIQKLVYGASKKAFYVRASILVFLNILTFALPVTYSIDDNGVLVCTGLRGTYMSIVLFSMAFAVLLIIIKKRKKINTKKVLPFIFILLLQIFAYLAEIIDPSINILPLSTTLISYLMYHTIENPDIKLISELKLAKIEAEKSNNAKSDFLSSMSHELRTPLNVIIGLSDMIKTKSTDIDSRKDAEDILLASENLLELIDDILDVNKIDVNKMDVLEDVYKLDDVITDLLKNMDLRMKHKNLKFNTNISHNLPYELYGDKEKIKRILNNLLTNAIKYTDEGQIDFIVECNIDKNNANLKFIVKDTGRGIDNQLMNNIFKKFYRLEEDKDSNIHGAGLGLAITKSLVDLLDGKIDVESIPNQGSTFTFELKQRIVTLVNNKEEQIDIL